MLKFYLKDGTTAVRDCPNTGHQDCWTPEYRAKVSAKRRREGTNPKGGILLYSEDKMRTLRLQFPKSHAACRRRTENSILEVRR